MTKRFKVKMLPSAGKPSPKAAAALALALRKEPIKTAKVIPLRRPAPALQSGSAPL